MTKKKRIVLKVGSNTLTKQSNAISRGKIEDIARQIRALDKTYEFVIVSSGAVAVAKQFVELEGDYTNIIQKQALASIGQPHLMRIFQEGFRDLGLKTAQCLVSYADFERETSRQNIHNTINTLVENNYIPIVNENDTVAFDEIKFGDNDKLASLTAQLIQADLLIIATNTNGICTKESVENNTFITIEQVHQITDLEKEIADNKSSHGTGGMQSKIQAAQIAQDAGIETWIVNGLHDQFITHSLEITTQNTKPNTTSKSVAKFTQIHPKKP